MQVVVCPRCRRTNPGVAVFCYFDGAELRPHVDGAGTPVYNRLLQEFVFPSGRRCRTFDELAQGCAEEWGASRDLLRQGVFGQFFTANGRADLVKAAQEAQAQADPDIALFRFVNALPVSPAQKPRLDLSPRRLLLGNLVAGESRTLQMTVSNQGQGTLQGTLKVTEGGQWLRLTDSSNNGQCSLRTARDQQITLTVDTRGLAAAQTYGAKLTVITNGGVVEVPVRMDLLAQPFGKPPFHGAKTPREMAERMRSQPKAAVPLLESSEIGRWFAGNGWNYPVRGTPARGVAGVQQFFEAMGLSRPPVVQVTQPEVRFSCTYPERQRFQVPLSTKSRKWVYASVDSDSPWLRVLTPQISGPQQAAIAFEVDSRQLPSGRGEGRLNIVANAGQTLSIRVLGEARGAPAAKSRGLVKPVLAMALACLILRLLLVPVVEFQATGPAARAAAQKVEHPTDPDRVAMFIQEQITIRAQGLDGLTPRQREISQLIAEGKSTEEVAKKLGLSVKTVESQRTHLMKAQEGLRAKQNDLAKRIAAFKPLPEAQRALNEAVTSMNKVSDLLGNPPKSGAVMAKQNGAIRALEEARVILLEHSSLHAAGGWLTLPWRQILLGSEALPAALFNTVDQKSVPVGEFRHYFLGSYIRRFVGWTWWVGALLGVLILWRRGDGLRDLPWGLVAGAVAGCAAAATLACLVLVLELMPHSLWGQGRPGFFLLLSWIFLVLIYWAVLGALVGFVCGLVGPLRRAVVGPVQNLLARVFRLCGLKGLARSWAAS